MSASLRDQRLRVYAYTDAGTNGVPDEQYVFDVERWGRINALGAKQFTIGEQAEHVISAIAEFSSEVRIPENGVIACGGAVYFVRGVMPRPIARAVDVLCERCTDALPTLVDP